MCGRYTLSTPAELISELVEVAELPDLSARYNVAPSQEALIIGTRGSDERRAGFASWGLTTPSVHSGGRSRRFINARIETAPEKRSFRDAFERRRCLVPADGFFEWQATEAGKTPVYFSLEQHRPFAFAGLWNPASSDDQPPTFAILTTRPNAVVSPVHDRMPVILDPETYELWLSRRRLSPAEHELLSKPRPGERLRSWPVSPLVNSPANDVPECIVPMYR